MRPMLKVGLAVGAVVAAAVVVVLLVGGDEREARGAMEAAFEAVRSGDADGALRYVSRDYDDGTWRYIDVEREVRALAGSDYFRVVEIDGMEVNVIGPTAEATLRLKGPLGQAPPGGIPRKITLSLRREGSEPHWRVVSAKADE